MAGDTWRLIGVAAFGGAGLVTVLLLWLFSHDRRARLARRLYWITKSTAAFVGWVVAALGQAGYSISERVTTRKGEVILRLADERNRVWAAIVYPGLFPVTSDQVGVLLRAMAGSQADRALLFTRSIFTPAALQRAKGQPLTLVDRDALSTWVNLYSGQRKA